jgi:hypothetical protein
VLRSFFSVPLDSVLLNPGDASTYWYFFDIPDGHGGYTRFTLGVFRSADIIREGAYFSTSTKGIPGNTYTLKVEYEGQEYTATDYMCYGTTIDSLSVEPLGGSIHDKPDGSDGFLVPCLYFAEPQDEVNFYMFNYFGISYVNGYFTELDGVNLPLVKDLAVYGNLSSNWPISVVSDRFMPPYVYQYKMSDGDDGRRHFSGTDMGFWYGSWDEGGAVDMYCISEPVYRYYSALSKQYYDDGGAFSPSPASPPTNISGGAQGCFSAASVSRYVLDLRHNENK